MPIDEVSRRFGQMKNRARNQPGSKIHLCFLGISQVESDLDFLTSENSAIRDRERSGV